MPTTVDNIRSEFFELIFGDESGVLCIATTHVKRGKDSFKRFYFRYPEQIGEILAFIAQKEKHHNVWFSTALFDRAEAKKEYAQPTQIVWADLDTCDPENISPQPPIVLQSSPGRWQALWILDSIISPEVAEDYSKRIAYYYKDEGADKSGWDIGQLLRVPGTHNMKIEYQAVGGTYPEVEVTRMLDMPVPVSLFEGIEQTVNGDVPASALDVKVPDEIPDAIKTIGKYQPHFTDLPRFVERFETEPDAEDDWSSRMWNLINMCFEAGMDEVETFAVARSAKCNKYKRDNRPERYLWLEVLKAKNKYVRIGDFQAPETTFVMPQIYDGDTDNEFTFVDTYREYGQSATDAPSQFHDLGGFMILSAVLAGNLKLETSYGVVRPNLWGLVLGETTLTRKSTSMNMAMEVVAMINKELFLTTEGSIEGILSALALRNHKTSIFFRDEVSGFFQQIAKKDFMSGTQEVFTQLYDVPQLFRRTLRKEVISVESPVFVFFGGGIRDHTFAVLKEDSVASGFLPRFLIVTGKTDIATVRPTGPASANTSTGKDGVVQHAASLYNEYCRASTITMPGSTTSVQTQQMVEAFLTQEAWDKYNEIETTMLTSAYNSPLHDMALPTMQRLSGSMLKMSMLIAGSRQEPVDNHITVERRDIVSAAKYIQQWGNYSIDMIMNVGKGSTEREIQKTLRTIQRHPGIARTYLMRFQHLTKRDTDDLIDTLLQRGHIRVERLGKALHYYPIED